MDIPFHYYVFIAGAILLAIGLVRLIARRGDDKTPAQNPYVEALKMIIDNDHEGAFRELNRAVKSGFAPTDAYIKLGNLLRARGEASKALQIHQSLTVKTNLTKPEKTELFLHRLAPQHGNPGTFQCNLFHPYPYPLSVYKSI